MGYPRAVKWRMRIVSLSLSLWSVGESTRSLAWNDRPRLRSAVITPKCEGLLVIIMIERRNIIPQGRNLLYSVLLFEIFYGIFKRDGLEQV